MLPARAFPVVCGLLLLSGAFGRADTTNRAAFTFKDYLVAPLRVHLLSATNSRAIQTTLKEADIARILKKINGIWAQAGICFYLESLVREEAAHQELGAVLGKPEDLSLMLNLRPEVSKQTNMFHLYYVKEFSANGVYLGEAMFVKDTASLRPVPGGIDEPLPRASSHELGHALGLAHHAIETHLLARRTTGTNLDAAEIRRAREAAKKFPWIEPAPLLLKAADELHGAVKVGEARLLYKRLSAIPLDENPVKLARQRAGQSPPAGP